MKSSNALKAVDAIKKALGDEDGKQVVKTFKAKPEWVKKFQDLEGMAEEIAETKSKLDSIRDGLWGNIHEDLDLYSVHLHYNRETREIEQMEDSDDDM